MQASRQGCRPKIGTNELAFLHQRQHPEPWKAFNAKWMGSKRHENIMSWIDNTANNTASSRSDYTKEFGYLDQIVNLVDFDLFEIEKKTLCESNFCETIAWYIDCLQKEDGATREQKIQDLINELANFKWNWKEKRLYLEHFFNEKKVIRLSANWRENRAKLLQFTPRELDLINEMYKINNDWEKIEATFVWIMPETIPEWYWIRFRQSWVESKVMAENRNNFIESMKGWMEKAEGISSSSD